MGNSTITHIIRIHDEKFEKYIDIDDVYSNGMFIHLFNEIEPLASFKIDKSQWIELRDAIDKLMLEGGENG